MSEMTDEQRRKKYEAERQAHWMALTGRAWETRSDGLKGTKFSGKLDRKHNV